MNLTSNMNFSFYFTLLYFFFELIFFPFETNKNILER